MASIEDFAAEFIRRTRGPGGARACVDRKHVGPFLTVLAREGFTFAKECLDNISDPELRQIVEAIFLATLGGAAAGATIGGMVAGPPGAKVGAVVGAAAGFITGCVAVTIYVHERNGDLVIEAKSGSK
jgi:hypothetical protein